MNINLLIADATHAFTEHDRAALTRGCDRAKNYVTPRLHPIASLDIVVAPCLRGLIIPEDHLGAYTYTSSFILLTFIPGKIAADLVYEVICHELCHAIRWQYNPEPMQNLFDGMILEGLAVYFEQQASTAAKLKDTQFYFRTVTARSDSENQRILRAISGELDRYDYDFDTIFITGSHARHLPRWAAYSAGFYLVCQYLAATGKTINSAFADPYADFRLALPK